jgi:REP element-mobilizing transposase RayT
MTNWRPNFDPDHLYFVTTTAAQHRHLFQRDVMKRLVVDTLDCMRLRGRFELYCFVVMPNHIHLIMQCSAKDPLADCVRDLKKQIADRAIRHYRAERNQAALDLLASAGKGKQGRRQVWAEGYNAKDVFTPEFLREKMTYIHENPCQPHWNLVPHPEDYVWSSARFYLMEKPAIIPLDNAGHLLA